MYNVKIKIKEIVLTKKFNVIILKFNFVLCFLFEIKKLLTILFLPPLLSLEVIIIVIDIVKDSYVHTF